MKNKKNVHGGPVVKNLPYNAGAVGLIPGWWTKISHAAELLSPHITIREPDETTTEAHAIQMPATTKTQRVR